MKKIAICLLSLLMVFSLSACGSVALSPNFSEDEVISKTKEITEALYSKDYDKANKFLRSDLQSKLPPEKLKASLDPLIASAGAFQEFSQIKTMGSKNKSTNEDYAICIISYKCEKKTITFTISLDSKLEAVGIFCK